MLNTLFHTLGVFFISVLTAVGLHSTPIVQAPITAPVNQTLGSSNQVPDVVALFETSLQSGITATQSTMTLVSATYNAGANTLASSTYPFVIDEGTSIEEIVTADCTGTICTNMTRGIDRLNGSSTVASLEFAHRRGASVKITNAPNLLILNRLIQGVGTFPNPISYSSNIVTATFTNSQQLVDKGYVDAAAFSGAGVISATEGAQGVSQLATKLQQASSTATVGSNPLVLQSKYATSTYNAAAAGGSGLNVVVTQNNNTIDGNFIPTTIPNAHTLSGTTTLSLGVASLIDQNGNAPIWSFIASTSLAAGPATSMTLSNLPARKLYHAVIYLESGPSGGRSDPNTISFNGDTGNNYNFVSASSTILNGQSGFAGLRFADGLSSSQGIITATMDIFNLSSTTRSVQIHYSSAGYGTSSLQSWSTNDITGIWATSTPQAINQIKVVNSNSNNYTANSSIYLYGSSF